MKTRKIVEWFLASGAILFLCGAMGFLVRESNRYLYDATKPVHLPIPEWQMKYRTVMDYMALNIDGPHNFWIGFGFGVIVTLLLIKRIVAVIIKHDS